MPKDWKADFWPRIIYLLHNMNFQSDFQRMGQGKKRLTAQDTTWVGQSKLYFGFLFVKQTCKLMMILFKSYLFW